MGRFDKHGNPKSCFPYYVSSEQLFTSSLHTDGGYEYILKEISGVDKMENKCKHAVDSTKKCRIGHYCIIQFGSFLYEPSLSKCLFYNNQHYLGVFSDEKGTKHQCCSTRMLQNNFQK